MSDEVDERTRALVRALLYPTIFEADLNETVVARVAEGVRGGRAFAAPRDELEAAARTALASGADLADWVAPQHSDTAVRAYLAALLLALQSNPA